MADYTINVGFNDNNAGKKLDDLDKKVKEVTKPAKLNIQFPDLEKTKRNLQEVSKYSGLAVTAFKQFTPIGREFTELEDHVKVVGGGLANVGRTLSGLSAYANPVRGIADGFNVVASTIQTTIDTTARLGFAIFGVTQSVNILKSAFGQMFEDTVGREVKLREQILQTATTLAGTNRIFANGFEIKDPVEKLKVLEGSVNKSIERIRDKSLEIAGTTSEAMIQVFNIVASQIGNFGGTMKQAEDLAAKFSGALGTLGMSDPMYAQQEIGSIMMGNIDMNSRLAKTLGITNQDIQKAKEQGKLYEFLSQKLAIFEAGQKKAAQGFAGITSNIQELSDELKRSFGSALLDPILKRLSGFYDKLSGKETLLKLKQTAQAFGQLVGGSLNSAYGIVTNAPVFKGIDAKGIQSAADKLQSIFAKVAIYIQEQLARIAPSVQRIIDRVVSSVAVLGKAFTEVGAAIVRLKFDQIAIQLKLFSELTPVILAAAKAYGEYLNRVSQIISTPIGRYLNELSATFKVLDKVGVIGLANFVMALLAIKRIVPGLIEQFKGFAAAIGGAIQGITARVAALIPAITGRITQAVSVTVTAVTVGVLKILALIQQVAGRIEISLNVISTKLMLSGGVFAKLSGPILAVSQAFGAIATAAQKAELKIADLGAKGVVAMRNLQTGAQGAAASVNGLGVSLREGVANGAKAAGGAIAGFALNIAKGIGTMILWQVALTVVVDLLRRLGEWWESFSQKQEYKQSVDDLNSGLLDQVKAAREAGRALDAVTEARKKLAEDSIEATLNKDKEALKELAKELRKREQNIRDMRSYQARYSPESLKEDQGLTNQQVALKRDPDFAKRKAELEARIKENQRLLNELRGLTGNGGKEDPQLRQQENRQQIEDLAKFEKDTRRSVEDEIYNYRRQVQQKELEVFRTQGDLRIQQVDQQNRRLIEGVDSEARASLEALNNWLSTKRKGELDLEVKKREAQMAAVEVERAIGRFRLQLEQQVAEIRKRIQQYEIDVLDRRIKAEQLIANIRNNSVQFDSPEGVPGDTGLKMGETGRARGAHWHVAGAATEAEARAIFARGSEAVMTSPPGVRNGEMHNGWDLSGQALGKLVLANGYRMVDWIPNNGNMGNTVVVERISDTKRYQLGHTANPDPGWTFFQGTGQAGAAPGTRQARDFREGYLMRMSNLEGGYGANGSSARNPSSNARGYFQLIPSTEQWLRSSGKASIADGMLSKDFNTAAQAAYQYAIMMRPAAQQLFAQGDTAGLDRLLNRLWTSLPGGAEEATGQRLARGNAFLKGGGATGSASLASVGGAPAKPNVMLNIDSSELDTAAQKLKDANTQLIELQQNQNALNSAEAFSNFVKSLDTTSLDLEKINKQVKNQKINLKAIAAATEGGIYDPATLEVNVQYQQALAALDTLRKTQLETLAKLGNATTDDRLKGEKAISEMYEKNKKNLSDILNKKLQALNLDKEVERLTQINADRRQAQLDLTTESARLQSEARAALLSPDDFQGIRREQALQQIQEKYLRLTEGDTKPLTETVKAAFQKEKEQLLEHAKSLAALDEVINESRRIRDMQNQIEQSRIDRLNSEASARTEVAKSALDPTNFRGLRRLDAEQQIYAKYLELSKGGIQALTSDEQAKLQSMAEQFLATADALAKVDTELKRFADRLALARESAQVITEGYKGVLMKLMNNGDLKEAVSEMGQNVATFFGGKILDYAFKPIQDQFEKTFSKLFGVDNVQTANTNALETLTAAIQGLTTTIQKNPGKPGALPEVAATSAQAAESLTSLNIATGELATGLKNDVPKTKEATEQTLTNMQKYTTGLAGVAASVIGIAGGVQMMKSGGTYNTLIGLSSIFGALGSFTGMFGRGGIFARAAGGPVLSNTPYLVGERGPELFMPSSSGQIIPNDRTAAMFQDTRAALAAQRSNAPGRSTTTTPSTVPGPIEVRTETQVINNVEYVTAEQHRKGMQEAARRGQMLAYQGMQHSVKVRRRLGM